MLNLSGPCALLFLLCFIAYSVGSVCVGGYGGLSGSSLCVFRELCRASFLVVGESPSVFKFQLVFVGFWEVAYVGQLLYVWYYVGVKSRFQHAREECESKRVYVF